MTETTELWQAESPMAARSPNVLTALFARRTWAEFAYALLGLPLGILGFVYTVVTLSLSAGLLVTFLGLPLLAVTNIGARFLAGGARQQANILLGAGVPAPPPVRRRPGLFGFLRTHLSDGAAWRARLYLVLKLPLGVLSFSVAVGCYVYGLGGVTYWFWRPFLPCNEPTGVCHRGANFGPSYPLDTPGRIAMTAVSGLLLLLIAPWAVHAAVSLDRVLVRALLGPSASAARLAELERTRAHAVDDSAATLRRIERDLHDGTQARLVALAINVGLAKEKLDEGADPTEARALLETAHTTAKDAIVELRDLARGIHPPVLDAGLDAALATLAAHSAVPVELRTALAARPAAAVETIAYFCAAELLTNVAKHSGAQHAVLDAHADGSLLRLRVSDDGHGGARIGAGTGTGLRGLAERARTVDGRLSVESPDGGPTVVTVELPMQN